MNGMLFQEDTTQIKWLMYEVIKIVQYKVHIKTGERAKINLSSTLYL